MKGRLLIACICDLASLFRAYPKLPYYRDSWNRYRFAELSFIIFLFDKFFLPKDPRGEGLTRLVNGIQDARCQPSMLQSIAVFPSTHHDIVEPPVVEKLPRMYLRHWQAASKFIAIFAKHHELSARIEAVNPSEDANILKKLLDLQSES